ncbi:meiosis-specific nuclear structural protein 1-like [Palaemon carinicauda]|uniref:meiosis-specific nuclear structural protein 1-like n=1 Tax=Palaemon carinicauda TaxID=392227 RepID=UPI0035B5F756
MGDSPSPPGHSKFQYDSFDLEQSSVSPSPTLTIPQGRDGERTLLMSEVIRLYKERYRLARMHRKAELRVAVSLKRRRQSEDGEEGDDDDDDGSHIDWAAQANKARTALLEADQAASAQELQYRLLLEESKAKAEQAAAQAFQAFERLIQQQRNLVKRSFSPLPREKNNKEIVENLLQRQLQVQEQLQQAREAYFGLAIKKQQLEEDLQRKQDTNDDQVSIAEMLRLVVETESFTEETGIQESVILVQKAALKKTEGLIVKQQQQQKELASEVKEIEDLVAQLQQQLQQKKEERKKLSEKQVVSQHKKSTNLKPATRLILEPILARDLETKLSLKVTLEDELQRLKTSCSRNKKNC